MDNQKTCVGQVNEQNPRTICVGKIKTRGTIYSKKDKYVRRVCGCVTVLIFAKKSQTYLILNLVLFTKLKASLLICSGLMVIYYIWWTSVE